MPCLNEARTIGGLLEAIRSQTFPTAQLEVVIADGLSADGTRERIEAFAAAHPDLEVRLIDNPERAIPKALNRAIAASTAPVVMRLDAHSLPDSDYVERCLTVLEETGAACVGGRWKIEPSRPTWAARAIAAAAAHRLSAGDARYRTGGKAGEVDTVPFGAFERSWLDRVGPYEESLLANEDYELNARLRRAGGRVWFDPSIRSTYFSRPDFASLARQYWNYGYWKVRMLRRHPGTLRWRQAIPPAFILSLGILSLVAPFSWTARVLLALEMTAYGLLLLLAASEPLLLRGDVALFLGLPLAIATMHASWGAGFLRSWLAVPAAAPPGGGRGSG